MSLRLICLTWAMRHLAKPRLAVAQDAVVSRRDFDRGARMFCVAPNVAHLVEPGVPPLHRVTARPRGNAPVMLYFHGGAYATGSPRTHRGLLARLARLTGMEVFAPVYRLAPEHPAPAAYDDACRAFARLRAKGYAPGQIVLAGDSAGGGLALALLAHLCATDQRPMALVAFSPWTDLALTGASLVTNADKDPLLPAAQIGVVVAQILQGFPPRDPRISPLFADFDRPPPVLIQVGTEEILLDDSRRMAAVLRAAGGQVSLTEWPGCPHVWQILDGYLPEARAALREVAGFLATL